MHTYWVRLNYVFRPIKIRKKKYNHSRFKQLFWTFYNKIKLCNRFLSVDGVTALLRCAEGVKPF